MSKYSFELRDLFEPIKFNPPLYTRGEIEAWFKDYELSDYLTDEQIQTINNAGIWSKDRLARKIVNHYYMRESGLETIGLFKHYAKVMMDEIMEEYLPLIYSACIYYDPLVNVDYTETFTRSANTNGSSNSSSSSSSSGLVVGSNTPQGQITKAGILAGDYASSTSANENSGSISDTSQSAGTTQETYSKNVKGNSGVSATAQKMIVQYRENIRAIDKEIIEKLDILFMGLY